MRYVFGIVLTKKMGEEIYIWLIEIGFLGREVQVGDQAPSSSRTVKLIPHRVRQRHCVLDVQAGFASRLLLVQSAVFSSQGFIFA